MRRRTLGGLALLLVGAACSAGPPPVPGRSPGASLSSVPTTAAGPSTSAPTTPQAPLRLRIADAGFSLPQPRQRLNAVEDAGSVLVAGGLDAGGTSTDDVLRLAPVRDTTTRVGTTVAPFHDAAAAMVGGHLVVFGGGPSSGTDLVQDFDPASGGSRVIGHLPTVSSDLVAATVGGLVVLVGGYDNTNYLRDVLATSDGTTFRVLATLPVGLRYAAVTPLPKAVLVIGGVSTAGPVTSVYRVSVPGGTVRQVARLPDPLGHASAVTLSGRVYVLGGEGADGQTVRSVLRISPASGTVRRLAPLPDSVADAAVVATGPRDALLIGGRRGPAGNDVVLTTVLRLRLAR